MKEAINWIFFCLNASVFFDFLLFFLFFSQYLILVLILFSESWGSIIWGRVLFNYFMSVLLCLLHKVCLCLHRYVPYLFSFPCDDVWARYHTADFCKTLVYLKILTRMKVSLHFSLALHKDFVNSLFSATACCLFQYSSANFKAIAKVQVKGEAKAFLYSAYPVWSWCCFFFFFVDWFFFVLLLSVHGCQWNTEDVAT